MLFNAIVPADALPVDAVDNKDPIWVEAMPARIYHTPQYGQVPMTIDKLQRMVKNFNDNVRGQEIATDFDHGMDRSKGNGASGWYRDFAIKPSSDDPAQFSLYAAIEFTDEAKQEIKDKKWKYFSLEWEDEWLDNSGKVHQDVITGGGITNRPIAKKAMPINFSEALWNELDDDTKRQFAVLTTAQRNALPKSAFLYVEKDGTTHLPYRKADGSIDVVHLRAAITRLSQKATGTVGGESWLTDSLRASLLAKARKLLAGSNKMSESGDEGQKALELVESLGLTIVDESADWEHSEPGQGGPRIGNLEQTEAEYEQGIPATPVAPNTYDDPAIEGGWRRDPLPLPQPGNPAVPPDPNSSKEGVNYKMTPEELKELEEFLKEHVKLDDGEKVVEKVKVMFSEAAALRQATDLVGEEKRFAEQFPQVWREHQELAASQRTNDARAFSESVKIINRTEGDGMKATDRGLSTMAIEKVAEVHKKFAEGTVTLADFEDTVKTIVNGGIVQFGEKGSAIPKDEPVEIPNATTAQGSANARKMFAEKVIEVQERERKEKPAFTYSEALALATKENPELANAYRQTVSA